MHIDDGATHPASVETSWVRDGSSIAVQTVLCRIRRQRDLICRPEPAKRDEAAYDRRSGTSTGFLLRRVSNPLQESA